jgi:hypothetical protein
MKWKHKACIDPYRLSVFNIVSYKGGAERTSLSSSNVPGRGSADPSSGQDSATGTNRNTSLGSDNTLSDPWVFAT